MSEKKIYRTDWEDLIGCAVCVSGEWIKISNQERAELVAERINRHGGRTWPMECATEERFHLYGCWLQLDENYKHCQWWDEEDGLCYLAYND